MSLKNNTVFLITAVSVEYTQFAHYPLYMSSLSVFSTLITGLETIHPPDRGRNRGSEKFNAHHQCVSQTGVTPWRARQQGPELRPDTGLVQPCTLCPELEPPGGAGPGSRTGRVRAHGRLRLAPCLAAGRTPHTQHLLCTHSWQTPYEPQSTTLT